MQLTSSIIVERAFLMEAEQPTINDDQNIIREDVEAEKEKMDEGPKDNEKEKEK